MNRGSALSRAIQFLHLQTFSRKPNPVGQHIAQILGEVVRQADFSPHVSSPRPPRLIFGLSIEELRKLHDSMVAGSRTRFRQPDGRVVAKALRKDRHTLGGAVASWPVPRALVEEDPEERRRYEFWRDLHIPWFRSLWGEGNFQTIVEHVDENYLHLHAYALPLDREDRDARRACNPAFAAKLDALEAGEAEGLGKLPALKAANRVYREVGRQLQDRYFVEVGAPSGLLRDGPRRRRMTRAEWRQETDGSRQASTLLMRDRVSEMEDLKAKGERAQAELERSRRWLILGALQRLRRRKEEQALQRLLQDLETELEAGRRLQAEALQEAEQAERRRAALSHEEARLTLRLEALEPLLRRLPALLERGEPLPAELLAPLEREIEAEVQEEGGPGLLARLWEVLQALLEWAFDLKARETETEKREAALSLAERQAVLRVESFEGALEAWFGFLQSGDADPLQALQPPAEMDEEGRAAFSRLREGIASLVETGRGQQTQAALLKTRGEDLASERKNLEGLQSWIEHALKNFGVLLRLIEQERDVKEIAPGEMEDAAQFEVLKKFAPENKPTLGFRARFWALRFSKTGAPYPFPEKIGAALNAAFDRAEAWGKERRLHREARTALEEQEKALQALQKALEARGEGQSLQEAAFALLQAGDWGEAIPQEERARRPEFFAALERVFPDRKPVRSLLLRFEALHAPDGAPLPLSASEREERLAVLDRLEAQKTAFEARRSAAEAWDTRAAARAGEAEALEARLRQAEVKIAALVETERRAETLRAEVEDLEGVKAAARAEGLGEAQKALETARALIGGDPPAERLGKSGLWLREALRRQRAAQRPSSHDGGFLDRLSRRVPEPWRALKAFLAAAQEPGWPHADRSLPFAERCDWTLDRLGEFWSHAGREIGSMARSSGEPMQNLAVLLDYLPFPDDEAILRELREELQNLQQAAQAERKLADQLLEEPSARPSFSGPSMG